MKNYIKLLNNEKDFDLPILSQNNDTYNNVTKWSLNKMKNHLKDNNIIIGNKSKHELKQIVNQLNNQKYNRLVDRICDLKKEVIN